MKKTITLLLACLLLCALAVNGLADETPTMTITTSNGTASVGDTITVTVSISKTENCTSVGLGITYDTTALEMVEGSFEALVDKEQAFCKYNANAGGYVANIQLKGSQTVSGELFTFKLKVKDGASVSGTYAVSGTPSIRVSGENVSCGINGASISIVCTHEYDNDCDPSCNLCGAERTAKHVWDDGEVTTDSTCNAEGVKTFTCTVCSETKTESVAKKEHTYDDGKVTTEATCDAEGVKTYTCTGCGETKTETIAKKKHSYDDGVVTTEPSCTAEGVKTFTCAGCGKTKTEAIDKKEHTYDDGKVTTDATCTDAGVKTFTCSGCGGTKTQEIESKGHSYDGGKVTTEATCTGEGVKTITCTVCGKVKTEAIESKGHSYDDGVVTTEATCTTDGAKDITCTVCGKVKTETIPAPGHAYDHDCDPDCNTCGETRETEHNYSDVWSSDETGHWHECISCADVLELLPHTPGPDPTETEDQICLDCGYVLQPAGTHLHSAVGDWLSDDSGHWHLCECGETLDSQDHTWNEGTVDEEAGVITYFCTVCGHPKTETIQPPTESVPETQPQTQPSQPAETSPTEDQPGKQNEPFQWWIVILIVGVLLVAAVVFIIVGILRSKKKSGKYTAE